MVYFLDRKIIKNGFLLSFLFMAVLSVSQLRAQNLDPNFSPKLGISTSYSPNSFKLWGKMQNTELGFLRLQYWHSHFRARNRAIEMGSELILTGLIDFPVNGEDGPRQTRFGFGMTPLKVFFPLSTKSNTPFLSTSAGFLVTEQKFPNSRGSSFNYLLDTGLGYQFTINNHVQLRFLYSLHHLSNGNSAAINPGVDSHLFSFTFVLF